MDWQKIIELVITHFSWPITIFIIILIFKNKLGGVAQFKAKDFEISFENEFKSIKKDIKNESRVFIENKSFKKTQWEITSTQALRENMFELSEKSPLGVVLQAWGTIENTVIECAVKKGFNNMSNPSAAIQYLCDNKYLHSGYINFYFRLFALKEKFTNFENEIVTKERALETADVILKIAGEINELVNISDHEKAD